MSKLHICNTFFESELESSLKSPLERWFYVNPIVTQLQFLPLLYAQPEDRILVTELPLNPDPRLVLLKSPPKDVTIEHWGPSQAIERWAKKHTLSYSASYWEKVRTMNSKIFSFTHSPKLPGATFLETEREVEEWIEKTPGPKVLKTAYGTAGKGHLFPPVKRPYPLPLIGEPWVQKTQDFSSQWENGKLLCITLFATNARGMYQRTYVGDIEFWAIEEHLHYAKALVQKIQHMGYAGPLGIVLIRSILCGA